MSTKSPIKPVLLLPVLALGLSSCSFYKAHFNRLGQDSNQKSEESDDVPVERTARSKAPSLDVAPLPSGSGDSSSWGPNAPTLLSGAESLDGISLPQAPSVAAAAPFSPPFTSSFSQNKVEGEASPLDEEPVRRVNVAANPAPLRELPPAHKPAASAIDAETIRTWASALPHLTGASLAEPILTAAMTAQTIIGPRGTVRRSATVAATSEHEADFSADSR